MAEAVRRQRQMSVLSSCSWSGLIQKIQTSERVMIQARCRAWRPGRTVMRDVFEFRAPLGVVGRVAERLVLRSYLYGLHDFNRPFERSPWPT